MTDRQRILVLVVLVAVVSLLFYGRARQKAGRPLLGQATPQRPPPPVVFKPSGDLRAPGSADPTTVRGDGKLHGKTIEEKRADVGLINTPLSTSDTHHQLRVITRPKPWCFGGDLDAIKLDLMNSKDKKLLLSIEPLRKEDGLAPVTRAVTPGEVTKGFERSFSIPFVEKPVQMGMYLCKDSGNTGSCGGKPATDVNRVFTEYAQKGMNNPEYRAPDRVYFFQYMLFEGDGSVSTFRNHDVVTPQFEKLSQYVGELPGGGKADEIQPAIDRARDLSQDIRSVELGTAQSALEIELPVLDKESCRH